MRHFTTTTTFLVACSLLGCIDPSDDPQSQSPGEPAAAADVEAPQVGGAVHEPLGTLPGEVPYFSGNWNYSWGDTKDSSSVIGTAANRTCFMTGLAGDLRPGDDRYFSDGFHPATAGVRVNASTGNYEIYVTPTRLIQVWARCVNSTAGLTAEKTWQSGTAAVALGAVTANRRCFLTQLDNHNWVYNSDESTGWYAFTKLSADYVRIWNDGATWYLGGSIWKGNVFATARCVDVSQDDGVWGWQSGDPGSRQDKLTNVGGATCGLTGLGGHFDAEDWVDGAYISFDAGINQFYMNTKNGKLGEAQCVK